MKKILAIVLALCLVLSLAACGGSGSSAPAASGAESGADNGGASTPAVDPASWDGNVPVQIGPDPETIDPALNSSVDGANMIITAFETLLVVDEDYSIIPGQAESYEVSDDQLTYTFHLRDGLKWSDGSDLTANDFVYAWKRVADPETAAPYASTVLWMVKGFDDAQGNPDADGNPTTDPNPDALAVSAPDAQTLVVELSTPCPYFLSLAAFATLSPVCEAVVSANPDTWAVAPETYVSNGPFHVTEWVPGERIVMSRNEYYNGGWDKSKIVADSLTFLLIEDSSAAYAAYNSGAALFIKDVPTDEIPSLTPADQGGDFYVDAMAGTYYISLNDAKEPFTDPKVRKALSLAIDREYVASVLMQGTYTPAYNFIGPGTTDADGAPFMDNANGGEPYISTDYEANLAEAKQLLADAGYPDGEGFPTITYSTNDAGYHKVLAEYLQQVWGEELGITLNIDVVEWASFTPMRRAGDYEISRNGWVCDYNDPTNLLELLETGNGNNDGKYSNPDYDAALDAARATTDPAERFAALHQAEDIAMEDAAMIPVAYYADFWLQSPSLQGIWHSAYGYWYLQYAHVA